MHCPRCGAQVKKGERYCASCGATLTSVKKPPRSFRQRVAELIGTTRRARIITAATAVAIALAVGAFFTLPTDEDEPDVPQDGYTFAAEEVCLTAKRQIAAETQGGSPGELARALVPLVAEWRSEFNDLAPPEDRAQLAAELDTALRDLEVEAGAMAGAARAGDSDALLERAERADAATVRIEESIESLGMEDCGAIGFALLPAAE